MSDTSATSPAPVRGMVPARTPPDIPTPEPEHDKLRRPNKPNFIRERPAPLSTQTVDQNRPMESCRQPAHDPRHALSLEIATGIMLDGRYVVELDREQHVRVLELRVAAKQAGDWFGFHATVDVAELPRPTVTITRADATDPTSANRVSQLRTLLQSLEPTDLRLVRAQPEARRSDDAST